MGQHRQLLSTFTALLNLALVCLSRETHLLGRSQRKTCLLSRSVAVTLAYIHCIYIYPLPFRSTHTHTHAVLHHTASGVPEGKGENECEDFYAGDFDLGVHAVLRQWGARGRPRGGQGPGGRGEHQEAGAAERSAECTGPQAGQLEEGPAPTTPPLTQGAHAVLDQTRLRTPSPSFISLALLCLGGPCNGGLVWPEEECPRLRLPVFQATFHLPRRTSCSSDIRGDKAARMSLFNFVLLLETFMFPSL